MNTEEQLFMWYTECFVILFTLKVGVCVVHEPRGKEDRDRGDRNAAFFSLEICSYFNHFCRNNIL